MAPVSLSSALPTRIEEWRRSTLSLLPSQLSSPSQLSDERCPMKSSTNGSAATDVASWLKTLPLAPEYHPTPLEFQDPIAYILKIEKEASQFGICKIIPPLPTATKKSTVSNLNDSFAARNPDDSPTFTTRQQQIGFCPRRPRPVQKPVWQSGERYTLTQFESKAKQFEREQLKKTGKKSFTPLEVETLFWRACAGKPFSVEYANDIPGSGFLPIGGDGSKEAGNVGESGWNMRTVSRARCSLLRFMKDDIPGVTSPMVYVGMMFSWFAWHVEDHDLHSLNYLHMGAGKTWYGVPRDAEPRCAEGCLFSIRGCDSGAGLLRGGESFGDFCYPRREDNSHLS